MPFALDSFAEIAPWVARHGYWIVFACLALENVLFASMVVPGLLVLIVAGYFAGQGRLDPALLAAVGVLGVWVGDAASYGMGRLLWSRILAERRFGKAMARVRPVLETRGAVFLVLYHFDPIARMVGATAAGSMGLSLRRWMPLDYLGGALWVLFYGGVGFTLGRMGLDPGEWERFRPLSAAVAVVLLAWLWIIRRTLRRSLYPETGAAQPATDA